MTTPIVECVPNFSEGRDPAVIDAITGAVRAVAGVRLLNVEPDRDYNRVVVTFVGPPDAVLEAAVQATRTAAERIDMARHHGEHPRIGATDVCPFVPVRGITMPECAALAAAYGARVAAELRIPVYLYGFASRTPQRRLLSDIRKGEYEGLAEKLRDPAWAPDFGAPVFNARSGATVAGARTFLIAYNVNLDSHDVPLANMIAARIRESGRPERTPDGKTRRDAAGRVVRIPGTLKSVQAMGVLLERAHIAQVSVNILDHHVTSIHRVFEEVRKEARALGAEATGSEIVGMVPLDAIVAAGTFYAEGVDLGERALVELAVTRLGLSHLEPFVPERKIIEYQL